MKKHYFSSNYKCNSIKICIGNFKKGVITINLQSLKRDFDNLLMKVSESIQQLFFLVSDIIDQIRSFGDDIQEKE